MDLYNDHLIISDLDGTLLRNDATLSDFARKSIGAMLDGGLPFTIATARSITSTKEILGDIDFRLPVICSNGGAIYSYGDKRPIHIEFIPGHTVGRVIDELKGRKDTAFVSCVIDGRERMFYDDIANEGMLWYYLDRQRAGDKRMERINDLRDCAHLPVTTITFMNHFYHLEATRKYYDKNFRGDLKTNFFENKYSPGWYWMSIHSPRSTKANAISRLMDVCGLKGRKLLVFGDENNDLPMFELADHPVAVGNALDPVKRAAREVISTNEEDAVVRYLEERFSLAG